MRYDTKIDYYDQEKNHLGYVMGGINDLGASKANELFGNMKEQKLHIETEKPLSIRSGFFKCKHGKFEIVQASLDRKNFYCDEFEGKL